MNKYRFSEIVILFSTFFIVSCGGASKQNSKNDNSVSESKIVTVVLPVGIEGRRAEFTEYVDKAEHNIRAFAKRNGWEGLLTESYIDSVMIFDVKREFDVALLKLAEMDTTIVLPATYCAALEQRTLICVTPEYYRDIYPRGIEEKSYEKLMTHEIAHRLHISILKGNEQAMGPIWFYEGFALYAADQFANSDIELDKDEMVKIITNPDRADYEQYVYVFRYIVDKVSLKDLVNNAGNEDFNQEMIKLLREE